MVVGKMMSSVWVLQLLSFSCGSQPSVGKEQGEHSYKIKVAQEVSWRK